MKQVVIFSLLVTLAFPAYPVGKADRLTVKRVRVDAHDPNGFQRAWVEFNGTITNSPSCVTNAGHKKRFGIRLDTPDGRAAYSMVLSALNTGSTMLVIGLGTCTIYNNIIEDWHYGYLYAPGVSPDEAVVDEDDDEPID